MILKYEWFFNFNFLLIFRRNFENHMYSTMALQLGAIDRLGIADDADDSTVGPCRLVKVEVVIDQVLLNLPLLSLACTLLHDN